MHKFFLWTVPGCHVLNASLTGGCIDRHVAMVMVLLRSGCSTAPVVSASHVCFFWLDFCQYLWGGFFVRLVGWFGILCCWVTQRVNLISGQLVLFCTTVLLVFSVTLFEIDQNKKNSKPVDRLSPESGNRKKVEMQRLSPRFRSQQFFLWKICRETFSPNL